MNFSGKIVLVFLEEDNTQRSYFRVRPLLTKEGPVDKQALTDYPDEGYLRIVPDKNEQHTFKERMRTLCGLCVMDLREMPPEISKIRTNKNYSPARGENNQFIVYSDAVQPLPQDVFYQVVPEDHLDSALTPHVFTRNGANIQGPVDCTTGQPAGEVEKLPPDSSCIYSIQLPDGKELLFYCQPPVKAEGAPEEKKEPLEEVKAEAKEEKKDEAAAEKEVKEEKKEELPVQEADPNVPPVQEEKKTEKADEPAAEKEAPAAPAPSAWQRQLDAIMSGKKMPAEPAVKEKEKEKAPVQKEETRDAQEEKKPVITPVMHKKADRQNALDQIQAMNSALNVSSKMKEENAKPFQLAPQNMQKVPLSGTKLYQANPSKRNNAPKAHNSLAETVDMQRNVSRYESHYEAPGAVIAANAPMNDVHNPVEQFRHTLQKVWMMPDTHRQVVDQLLSVPGMRQTLGKALCADKKDLTVAAMNSQLQELEAERLMTLMQLEDAQRNKQKIKDELLSSLNKQEKQAQENLEKITEEKKACVDELLKEQEKLLEERDKAAEKLEKFPWQTLIAPAAAKTAAQEDLIHRVMTCMKSQGFKMNEDDARALLVMLALSDDTQICLSTDTQSDALTAVKALSAALGTAYRRIHADSLSVEPVRVLGGGDAPVFTCDVESLSREIPGIKHVILCDRQLNGLTQGGIISEDYLLNPFMRFDVETDDEVLPEKLPEYPAVSLTNLKQEMLKNESPLSDSTLRLVKSLAATLRQSGAPLPMIMKKRLIRFIAACQNDMKGGVAAAIDYAVRSIIVPHVEGYSLEKEDILELMSAMPRTLKVMEE